MPGHPIEFQFHVTDDFGEYAMTATLDHRPGLEDLHEVGRQHACEMFESNANLQVIWKITVTSEDAAESGHLKSVLRSQFPEVDHLSTLAEFQAFAEVLGTHGHAPRSCDLREDADTQYVYDATTEFVTGTGGVDSRSVILRLPPDAACIMLADATLPLAEAKPSRHWHNATEQGVESLTVDVRLGTTTEDGRVSYFLAEA